MYETDQHINANVKFRIYEIDFSRDFSNLIFACRSERAIERARWCVRVSRAEFFSHQIRIGRVREREREHAGGE